MVQLLCSDKLTHDLPRPSVAIRGLVK